MNKYSMRHLVLNRKPWSYCTHQVISDVNCETDVQIGSVAPIEIICLTPEDNHKTAADTGKHLKYSQVRSTDQN